MYEVVAVPAFSHEPAARGAAPALPRKDMYGAYHKGLRQSLADVLTRMGATDFSDDESVRRVTSDLVAVLNVCEQHLRHENAHVHAAVERRRPGAMVRLDDEHLAHEEAIANLRAYAIRVEHASPANLAAEGRRLYLRYAAFVGENLVHMSEEEELAQALLDEIYTPEELGGIYAGLVASLTPEQKVSSFRLMLPAVNPSERVTLLLVALKAFPIDTVATLVTSLRGKVPETEWQELAAHILCSV